MVELLLYSVPKDLEYHMVDFQLLNQNSLCFPKEGNLLQLI